MMPPTATCHVPTRDYCSELTNMMPTAAMVMNTGMALTPYSAHRQGLNIFQLNLSRSVPVPT